MKITRRLLIPTVIFVAIVITALLSIQTWVESRRLLRDQEENLHALASSFESRLQADTNLAVALAMEVANNASIQAAFAARDRDALIALTLPSYQELETRFDIPQYQFHVPPATSFLRLHQLDRFGDDLSGFRQTVLLANANQEIVAGLEVGRGGMGLRGVAPVFYQGQHVGSVEFGSNLDAAVLQSLKETFGAEWQLTLREDMADIAVAGFVSEEPGPIPGLLLQVSTLETPLFGPDNVYTRALAGETVFIGNISQAGRNYSLLTTPLRDFSDEVIGTVDIIVDRTALTQLQLLRGLSFVLVIVVSLGLVAFGLERITGRVLRPVGELTAAAEAIAAGDRSQLVALDSPDELGALAAAFNKMTNELNALIETLETRVAARTRDLTASVEVSRSISTILDPDQLVKEVVREVGDAFKYYHTQIYLLDEATGRLRLVSATGAAGRALLLSGHSLAMGQGLVGQAAATNAAVFVPDVAQEPQWLPNPLLPETRVETAVPIAIGSQILGVLDVQHNVANGLSAESVELLQTIASQVAIALQNARQLAETKVSQERLSLIVAGSNSGIWDWDITTNQVYFSPRWKEIIGYDDEEISNDFAEFQSRLHPEDHDRVMQNVNDYLAGVRPDYSFEFRMRHKDGSYRWIEVNASLERDEQGAPLRMAGSHTDITERKLAEARISERETLLRTIIDATPDWIFVIDPDHRYLLVNQAYASFFNLTPDELLGKTALDLGLPEERVLGDSEKGIVGFMPDDQEVMSSGQIKVMDEESTLIEGQKRYINTIKAPLKDAAGKVVGMVGFVHDITNLKLAEEELRQEQERTQGILEALNVPVIISRLSDGLATYINEPMAVMIGEAREVLTGQRTPDFYQNPADRQRYIAALSEQGVVSGFEVGLKRSNGEPFWGLLSGRIIAFQGEPAVITSVIDVTARRQAQNALSQRANELQIVAQVGTAAATILDPAELLQEVVDLTKREFNLYHAHIYLMDEAGTTLRLNTGAGEIGQKMVAEGRSIPLNQEQSLVARAARTRQGVVINDVRAEPGFLPNPLLPETRAEMAVPLVVGDQVLGVLDVQAAEVERFNQEEVSIFTTLATQVAVALQNARRYDQAQRALDELTRIQRALIHEGWQAFLLAQERPFRGFHFDQNTLRPIAAKEETAVAQPEIALPLSIAGETIGKLGVRNPSGAPLSPSQRQLLLNLSSEVAAALERARLAEQTQLALSEAETLSKLSARLNAAQTYQQINSAVTDIMKARTHEALTGVLFDVITNAQNEPEWLELMTSNDETGVVGQYQRFPVTMLNSRPAWVASDGAPVLIANTQTDPRLTDNERALYQQTNVLSIAFLPLRLGGRWLGLFTLAWSRPVSFTEADTRILTAVVDQLALAINSIKLLNAAQSRARQEQMLREVSARVSAVVDAESVLKTATREIGRALGLETFIYLKSPNRQTAADTATTPSEMRQPAESETRPA